MIEAKLCCPCTCVEEYTPIYFSCISSEISCPCNVLNNIYEGQYISCSILLVRKVSSQFFCSMYMCRRIYKGIYFSYISMKYPALVAVSKNIYLNYISPVSCPCTCVEEYIRGSIYFSCISLKYPALVPVTRKYIRGSIYFSYI